MKLYSTLLVLLAFAVASCNKDKFETIPHLDINSISPSTVNNGDIIEMKGDFTDQEGDLDSALIIYKWYNGAVSILPLDTLRYSFAALNLPETLKEAEITVAFEYNTTNSPFHIPLGGVERDTTASFGLILIDREGHRSEYKESEKIRMLKP
jgi:hypothetical protein